MPLFESKPMQIEAVQFLDTPESRLECLHFAGVKGDTGEPAFCGTPVQLWVEKSQAWCDMQVGTWIIREPDGSGVYPCADEIFKVRWTLVGDSFHILHVRPDGAGIKHPNSCHQGVDCSYNRQAQLVSPTMVLGEYRLITTPGTDDVVGYQKL